MITPNNKRIVGANKTLSTSRVRARGLLHLVGGAAGFGVFFVALFWLKLSNSLQEITIFFLLPVPVIFALRGLLEIIFGMSFWELSTRWMALKGWQRGIIGILGVLPASGITLWLIIRLIKLFGRFIFR